MSITFTENTLKRFCKRFLDPRIPLEQAQKDLLKMAKDTQHFIFAVEILYANAMELCDAASSSLAAIAICSSPEGQEVIPYSQPAFISLSETADMQSQDIVGKSLCLSPVFRAGERAADLCAYLITTWARQGKQLGWCEGINPTEAWRDLEGKRKDCWQCQSNCKNTRGLFQMLRNDQDRFVNAARIGDHPASAFAPLGM